MTGAYESCGKFTTHLIIVLLLVPLGSTVCDGSSTIEENAASFSRGSFDSTVVDSNALALDYEYGSNDSWPDNWTLMDHGRPGNLTLPIAYDSANNVLVMESGLPYDPQNYTWIYDFGADGWTMRTPPRAPPYASVIAYDSSHGVVVMYYSFPSRMIPGETWAYNVSQNVWTNMSPAGGPLNLTYSAMVYDSVNKVLVLFGGSGATSSNDTWIYDFSANTWTNMFPANPPPARVMHAMAFDESCGEVILFGGRKPNSCNDTWGYDAANNSWTQRFPQRPPPATSRSGMVYDSSSKEMILFGGETANGYCRDTWTYSSSSNCWTKKNTEVAPSNRTNPGMAFNSRENELILFGGYAYPGALGDLWTYNSSRGTWIDITEYDVPSPRLHASMEYDGRTGKSILFGGVTGFRALHCETYSYDLFANKWTRLNPETGPSSRYGTPLVSDRPSGEMVLFGGHDIATNAPLGDTWTYNSITNTWTNRAPPSHPSDRELHALEPDRARDRILLFGGMSSSDYEADTWSYDIATNTWTELFPPYRPNGRAGHAMAYDVKNDIFVMFGGGDGYCTYADTWIYNVSRNTWTNKTPGKSPPGRCYHSMVYDGQKGLIVMFGGMSADGNDTWCYDTNTNKWTKIQAARAPTARYGQAMTYDEANHALVLFGGVARYDTICGDVWAFDLKHLTDRGNFTSAQLATGGEAHFGALEWESDTPGDTALRFQLRTADFPKDLTAKPFVGPDGTPATFYEGSGQGIASIHNGSRWVQYRAYFSSPDPSLTPLLGRVAINFNLPPALAIFSPQGGEIWTGEQTISWTAIDSDNDMLSFDLFLENVSGSFPLATGLQNGTNHWTWNTSTAANGTYSVRIVANTVNASIPLSADAASANFSIYHPPPPNHPPHVDLRTPADRSIVNSTSVRLEWTGSDPDGDQLTYTVSHSTLPLFSGYVNTNLTTRESLDLPGLRDNTTYYWTVDANDTKTNRTDFVTPIWRFTVQLPPPNKPPKITSVPGIALTAGERYVYNITATDEDGNALVYSIVSGPPNMIVDGPTGWLRWAPGTSNAGNHTVTVEVSDGRGGIDRQTFTIVVLEAPTIPPPAKPVCRFTYPANGSTIAGRFDVRGAALRGAFPLVIVRLRIDGGEWTTALGLENWSLVIDTDRLGNGMHRLEAWAFDGNLRSDTASMDIIVDNREPASPGPDYPHSAISAVIIAVSVIIALFLARRKLRAGN